MLLSAGNPSIILKIYDNEIFSKMKSTTFNHFNSSFIYSFIKRNTLPYLKFRFKYFLFKFQFILLQILTLHCYPQWHPSNSKQTLATLGRQKWTQMCKSLVKKKLGNTRNIHWLVTTRIAACQQQTMKRSHSWDKREVLSIPITVPLSWEEFCSTTGMRYAGTTEVVTFFFCLGHHGALGTNTESTGFSRCAICSG